MTPPPAPTDVLRAKEPEEKAARRQAILDAASALLARRNLRDISVADVAAAAGLAKGTVYLYFQSREEVFLVLHHVHSQQWFDALDALLDAGETVTPGSIADLFCDWLRGNPQFFLLAGVCHDVLECAASVETNVRLRIGLAERLAASGARIERHYPQLGAGDGARLLVRSYATMIGLWQLADAPDPIKPLLQQEEMFMFRIDYFAELRAALVATWRGELMAAAERNAGNVT